jgi:steroid 5-alpha reductase family enzyme
MAGDIWALIGTNLLVMLVVMTLIAIPSFTTRDPSYIDAFWGIGFVIIAASSYLQTDGDPARKGWLLGLCALWGLRLGGYLLWRWRKNGPDPRYQAILKTREGGSVKVFIWRRVFLVQAFVLTLTALPVQLGQVYDDDLTALNVVGIVLALFGIVFESTADLQLARFKGDPANHGQVMDKGLWFNTRHPNYFGETCTWWGLFLVAVSNGPTVFAAIGPAIITFFLLKVSGVGLLEKGLKKTKPRYQDYIDTTSPFIPLPKRKKVTV